MPEIYDPGAVVKVWDTDGQRHTTDTFELRDCEITDDGLVVFPDDHLCGECFDGEVARA